MISILMELWSNSDVMYSIFQMQCLQQLANQINSSSFCFGHSSVLIPFYGHFEMVKHCEVNEILFD